MSRRPGRRASCRFSDRGSATVWSVGAVAVLCVVFGVVLALGHAVVARHRAAGGADLAALAAADHWAEGTTAACARAERVAGAQGTRLVRCAVVGDYEPDCDSFCWRTWSRTDTNCCVIAPRSRTRREIGVCSRNRSLPISTSRLGRSAIALTSAPWTA